MCSSHPPPGRKVLCLRIGQDVFSGRTCAPMRATVRYESVSATLAAKLFAKCSIPKGNAMAFKPNYGLQRADRNRAAASKERGKTEKKEEKSKRKAERTVEIKSSSDDERQNEEMSMTAAKSKDLKRGNRVYWRGDATDGGSVTKIELGCCYDRLG